MDERWKLAVSLGKLAFQESIFELLSRPIFLVESIFNESYRTPQCSKTQMCASSPNIQLKATNVRLELNGKKELSELVFVCLSTSKRGDGAIKEFNQEPITFLLRMKNINRPQRNCF